MKQSTNKGKKKPSFDDAIISSMKGLEGDKEYKATEKMRQKVHESLETMQ